MPSRRSRSSRASIPRGGAGLRRRRGGFQHRLGRRAGWAAAGCHPADLRRAERDRRADLRRRGRGAAAALHDRHGFDARRCRAGPGHGHRGLPRRSSRAQGLGRAEAADRAHREARYPGRCGRSRCPCARRRSQGPDGMPQLSRGLPPPARRDLRRARPRLDVEMVGWHGAGQRRRPDGRGPASWRRPRSSTSRTSARSTSAARAGRPCRCSARRKSPRVRGPRCSNCRGPSDRLTHRRDRNSQCQRHDRHRPSNVCGRDRRGRTGGPCRLRAGSPTQPTDPAFDPVDLAVLSSRFTAIARNMSNTLFRTGRSGILNTGARFLLLRHLTAERRAARRWPRACPIHVLIGPDIMAATHAASSTRSCAAATRSCTTRPTTATRTPADHVDPGAGVRRRRRPPLHGARQGAPGRLGNARADHLFRRRRATSTRKAR